MKLKIYQVGEPVLRQKSKVLSDEEIKSDYVKQLIELMGDTMRDAPGVGLASPQIGVSTQLAVIEYPMAVPLPPEVLAERQIKRIPFHVIINPRIVERSEEMTTFFEGCLSVIAYRALVKRHTRIKVECLNEFGEKQIIEAEGWYARILQHEIVHLEGNLFVDKMYSRSLIAQELYIKQKWDFRLFSEMKENFSGIE